MAWGGVQPSRAKIQGFPGLALASSSVSWAAPMPGKQRPWTTGPVCLIRSFLEAVWAGAVSPRLGWAGLCLAELQRSGLDTCCPHPWFFAPHSLSSSSFYHPLSPSLIKHRLSRQKGTLPVTVPVGKLLKVTEQVRGCLGGVRTPRPSLFPVLQGRPGRVSTVPEGGR